MKKNIKYMLIQMLFWMAYCSCYGFASYFLVEKGYGTTVVGVITAAAGILSAVCQPLLGSLVDRLGTGYKKPLLLSLANPFINLAGVSFADQINFGMARAAGSFGYALASYTIGYVSARFGPTTIPVLIQAQAQAYMANSLTIGTVIATFFGGIVIDRFGVNVMIILQCVSAALGLVGAVIWKRSVKTKDEDKQAMGKEL